MHTLINDFGAHLGAEYVGGGTATAGGAGDATKVNGATIDRLAFASGSLLIPFTATLAAAATLSFAIEIQESADGSSWDTAEVLQASTVAATGEAGGSTETGVVKLDDALRGRKRYVRYNITPDLSAGATDTCAWRALFAHTAETIPA